MDLPSLSSGHRKITFSNQRSFLPFIVIPAKAGNHHPTFTLQLHLWMSTPDVVMDSRLRGNDVSYWESKITIRVPTVQSPP
jgi:hypothetical protein